MAFNKLSGGTGNPATLPIALSGGEYFMLPAGQGAIGQFGGISTPQFGTGNPLSGQYYVDLGQYSALQVYDIGTNYWRNLNVQENRLVTVSSDGFNYRIANTTGCPIGAVITNAGSGLTNGFYGFSQFGQGQGAAISIANGIVTAGNSVFTITPNAGGSQWNAIIGGAVNTTLSFSGTVFNGNLGVNNTFGASTGGVTASGGTGYTRPPIIVFTPPPQQGLQPYILPTAVCTISGGIINAITVTNQGAGLLGLPGIVVLAQPGDTVGGGAVIGWLTGNAGQVGSGTLLAMWPAYYGTPQTAVTTFTFNPASTVAATAIMNFSVTSITNTTPGVGYTTAYAVFQGGMTAGAAVNTNPIYDKALSGPPIFPTLSVVAGTGVCTLAGSFGGVNIQAVPTIALGTQLAAGTVTTVAVQTPVVGGQNDVITLMSL
jgi:hypothetical protein